MSVGPDPNVNVALIEETRKQINRLFEEVARMSDTDMPPTDYYGEVLKRILQALAAPAGAVWVKTAQGNLQLQYQINLREVGLDRSEEARQSHDELLRQVFQQGKPIHLPPQASAGEASGNNAAPGNPSNYIVLLAPILVDKQAAGVIEIWQQTNRHPDAIQGFLQFLMRMADLCSLYTRNHLLRQMGGQQQLWTQLEAFARQVHSSLNPVEVAYQIANEGRRLIQCDRVSVGVRYGRKTKIEAISGADVVEKRSNLVQLMRKLTDTVLVWGEKLIYKGAKDDSLPPDVLKALDEYLAESASKLLAVVPLRDEREAESKRPARSAILMECFEPSASQEQLIARTDVVGKHATSALFNAVEHRRIPFRFIWFPIAKVQEGLGGKARAIIASICAGLIGLGLMLYFVPYPLKMDANGQVLPVVRQYVYAPDEGDVHHINVEPGDKIPEGQSLLQMRSLQLLQKRLSLQEEMKTAAAQFNVLQGSLNASSAKLSKKDETDILMNMERNKVVRDARAQELQELEKRTNMEEGTAGIFNVKSPPLPSNATAGQWTVLNSDFREHLLYRAVKPSDPLIRLGYVEGPWEIELKIPQKHIGQVKNAFNLLKKENELKKEEQPEVLDVDLLVRSDPTRVFKGKLHRNRVGGEAKPNQTEQNESEPIVLAYVRIEGDDIPEADRLPRDLLVTGTEVHAKVRCGNRKMGYSLFYGVWEFLYEKVIFFF